MYIVVPTVDSVDSGTHCRKLSPLLLHNDMSYISLPNNRHRRQKLFFLKLEIVLFLQLCCLFSPIYFLLRYFCIIHFSFQIDMQCKLKQNLFLERHLSLSVRVCQLNHDVKFPVADYGFWHPSRPSHWSLD